MVSNYFKKNDVAIPSVLTHKLNELKDSIPEVPTEQNKLLYSFNNQTLKADYLMYTDGLVVDNNDDFELCKEGADVSMSTVSSDWVKWGNDSDAAEWGYYSSDGSKTGEFMANKYKFTDFYLNSEPEGYIYNTKNTSHYTGYYSPNKFKDYDSHIAMGIMSKSTNKPYLSSEPGLNDYMAVLPVFNEINENGTTTYYGITVSVMNASEQTNSRNSVSGSGSHTISIECYSLTDLISNTGTVLSLLNDNIGKTIIAYNETFNNSSSTGLASVIQTKIKKYKDIITLWFSDPYSTYDNDGEHQVHSDRPVVINLNDYTVTYTDKSGETTIKDFSVNATVVEIFNKLCGGARRGYEVSSNPGSIFRNLTTDEIILNMSPDSNFNTTWKFYQDSGWTNSTQELTSPTQLFTGSKLSFNKVTNKLFYSDGVNVTYIGNISSGSSNLMINVTYDDLVSLVSNSGLTPGMQYRLIDYECTVANYSNAQSANHIFDIILVADNETTLNENVRFTHNEYDTYFTDSNLSAWEGKYTIDNDTNKFDWVGQIGKGVIYWLKDEWNNECPYDFKNIQFKRVENDVEKWYYTFTWVDENNDVKDASIVGKKIYNFEGWYIGTHNNQIQPVSQFIFYPDSPNEFAYSLNNIVFISTYDYAQSYFGIFGNKFGVNCYDNTFRNECSNNTFGNYCWGNTFGNHCCNNTLENSCHDNTFGNICSSNTFGNGCYYNTFGNSCYNNTLGNYFQSNTLGNYCAFNTFENDYIKQCRFGDGIGNCIISGITTGNDSYLQNINFLNHIKGESYSKQDLNVNNYLTNNVNVNFELFCGFDKNNVYKCKTMFDSML